MLVISTPGGVKAWPNAAEAVKTSPKNAVSAALYRDLVAAGAVDYLVKPLKEQAFSKAIDRALAQKAREASLLAASQAHAAGAMMVHPTAAASAPPRVVVFVGTRGGAGATTCAIATAMLLGEATKQQVLLMDLDLRYGTVMLALDLDPTAALREALDQPDRIDNLFIEQSSQRKGERLFVIGAEEPPTMELALKPNAVADVLREFQKRFRLVVIDAPRNDPAMQAQAVAAATDIVIVCDLSLAGVRDAMRLGSLIHEIAPKAQTHLLASGSGDPKKQPVQVADVERSLKQKVLFQVPFDEKSIALAVSAGKPLPEAAKASPIVKSLNTLVKRLDASPEPAKADGKTAKKPLFGFFKKG